MTSTHFEFLTKLQFDKEIYLIVVCPLKLNDYPVTPGRSELPQNITY